MVSRKELFLVLFSFMPTVFTVELVLLCCCIFQTLLGDSKSTMWYHVTQHDNGNWEKESEAFQIVGKLGEYTEIQVFALL